MLYQLSYIPTRDIVQLLEKNVQQQSLSTLKKSELTAANGIHKSPMNISSIVTINTGHKAKPLHHLHLTHRAEDTEQALHFARVVTK